MINETSFWKKFDAAYLADFAGRLVAIRQYELGFRLPGTGSGRQAADLIAGEMERIGLQQVRQEPFPVYSWGFQGAEVVVRAAQPHLFTASAFAAAPGTPPEGLTAEVVDVGYGTAAEYLGRDVRGKIAFIRMDFEKLPWLSPVAHEAELHGAAGVLLYLLNRFAQHESGLALNAQDGGVRETIPVLHLCRRDADILAALLAQGPVEATLYCQVTAQPQATGYNVIGLIPGSRYPDRYLLLQAHYDSWFYGYWDNTIGVAGMLAIAKALLESGYRPHHTLLFVSPDAEEFGAADTAYGWLTGCQRLLEAHPDWAGHMTCALNIDTLAHRWQAGIQFVGPAEMLEFIRSATAGYQVVHFPLKTISAIEQITPWTEIYNYTYFGIPTMQPRFKTEGDPVRAAIYHTQFDDASIVDLQGAAEILKLYGTLLSRLDQLPVVSYSFSERAHSIRASLSAEVAHLAGADLPALEKTLSDFEGWAGQLETRIRQINSAGESLPAEAATALNDQLRAMAAQLLPLCYFTEADFPDSGQYEHLLWQKELLALDQAYACLEQGDAAGAVAALTDPASGAQGGWYALNFSYPVYHRSIRDACHPARADLFWGRERTIPINDIWLELHHLQDKLARGLRDFAIERHTLQAKREAAAAGYRAALERLEQVLGKVVEFK